MLRMTISKIKKICSIALIPRILRDEVSLSPKKLGKRPLDGMWKMTKSTDSKDREAECEKCKKLIEKVFGSEKTDNILKHVEANLEDIHIDKIQKAIAPNMTVNDKFNKPNKLDTHNFSSVEDKQKKLEYNVAVCTEDDLQFKKPAEHATSALDNVVHSTTAKAEDEKLTQKVETIEELRVVEPTTPKIDGFNISPKVLGDKENVFNNKNSLCSKIAPEEDALDEIAKKCLSSPPDKIDERIIEEMKRCGMLGRGRRKPMSRRSGYHNIKSNEKEPLSESKSEQRTVYLKHQQKSISRIHEYSSMRNHSMKFSHKIKNAYFKNVPLSLVNDGNPDRNTKATGAEHAEKKVELEEVKPKLIAADSGGAIDQLKQIRSFQTEESERVLPNEEKPKEIIQNEEVEVEEMRVSAAETSRLCVPEETVFLPNDNHKPIKPEILQCNQILHATKSPIEEKSFEPDNRTCLAFTDSNQPNDWPLGEPDQPLSNSNTAISATYPQIDPQPEPETSKQDTAISSVQDPAEFYYISHSYMEKLSEDCAINPSTIRPLVAFQPYTIISTTDEVTEPENILFANKDTPYISSPELDNIGQIEIKDEPETINNNMSATMGPLPELQADEEIPLTEMLRRVRERNRLQYIQTLQAEPAEANKCPPPLDKGPAKTLGPGPCKPKPKPACPPPSPPCPPPSTPPCKPKDPCAKFTTSHHIVDRIRETFTLVLQVMFKPACLSSVGFRSNMNAVEPLKQILINDDFHRIEMLGSFLLSNRNLRKSKLESDHEDVNLVRDFEPWSPVPSWPIPEKEKKKPFVCPKEGCKIIPPPRLNSPCKENPCINLPKRKLSFNEFEYEHLYLYDEEL